MLCMAIAGAVFMHKILTTRWLYFILRRYSHSNWEYYSYFDRHLWRACVVVVYALSVCVRVRCIHVSFIKIKWNWFVSLNMAYDQQYFSIEIFFVVDLFAWWFYSFVIYRHHTQHDIYETYGHRSSQSTLKHKKTPLPKKRKLIIVYFSMHIIWCR